MKRSKRNSSLCRVDNCSGLQRLGGFTLMEMLVVMSIISVLMGMFVSWWVGDRRPWDQVTCDSNLRSLYLALQMYADDNDGRCPNPDATDQMEVSVKMKEALLPYVSEEIFWCPKDPERSEHPGGSYGWRVTRDPEMSLAGVRLHLLRHPDRVMIAGELSHGCHEPEKINVLYADGHVDLATKEEFLRNITTRLEF